MFYETVKTLQDTLCHNANTKDLHCVTQVKELCIWHGEAVCTKCSKDLKETGEYRLAEIAGKANRSLNLRPVGIHGNQLRKCITVKQIGKIQVIRMWTGIAQSV